MTEVLENLSEDEAYLFAILSDPSGLDQAEFLWVDNSSEDNKFCPTCGTARDGVHLEQHGDVEHGEWVEKYPSPTGCFRAWAYQWPWWREEAPLQVDQCARSVGKSLSVKVRGCAFPFLFPGQEMIITAPELVHLEPIVSLIESQMTSTRTLNEMLPRGRSSVTHRPFQMNFLNGARIIGRIPQRDGKGVKGLHPIWLELDECIQEGTLILTRRGQIPIENVVVGDMVWTHENRWQMVTGTFDRGHRETVQIRGQGHPGLRATKDHRFWARPITGWTAPSRREGPKPGPPEFIYADDLTDTYWSSPLCPAGTPFPEPVLERAPVGPGYDIHWRTLDFLWMFGLFAAEGSLSSSYGSGGTLNRIYWSIHTLEVEEVMRRAKGAGLNPQNLPVQCSENAANILVTHQALASWIQEHIGRGAHNVSLPSWVYSLEAEERAAVLDGIVYGDGFEDPDERYSTGRWKVTTVSRGLAVSIRLLAQSLGYHVSLYHSGPRKKPSVIRGREVTSDGWYQVVGNVKGQGRDSGDQRWSRVREVSDGGWAHVYDLSVANDQSFVADGIIVHNSQDYPHAGWVELNETLKRGFTGAMWRAHGVTKGVRDDFYEITQDTPENRWKVHRFAAMWRPNWTDQEREEGIQKYGSREDPDYRRNILGLHGDKTNPIFVLTQLMKNVDSDDLSDYNTGEYFRQIVKAEQLELFQQEITEVLDFPPGHLSYAGKSPRERAEKPKANYWVGMDIGFTIDPSEILVFVEFRPRANSSDTQIRLLSRVSLVRMPNWVQLQAMLHTIEFYRPKAFAMDRGGVGLPLFQELQEHVEAFKEGRLDRVPQWMHGFDLRTALTTIKGYNFSEKLLVDFDKSVELSPYDKQDDIAAKAGLRRNAKEYSTDLLREMVDRQQLWLPWDDDLLKQFQGGTWTSNRSMDAYGRRTFSSGNDHVLDAARMMSLGWAQFSIEELMKPTKQRPVLDVFLNY